ncbi:hypothetical protein Poli38472_009104 [Pythium oligandrum]|uniref:Transmembrane protein 231 n=1 Tax=Pythium oligandrum TaxID=41045 RepID=A0A8K1FMJ6_PYTOL|nr:hypothetical protein Poli38472_009104 [Pythium oligandrum]|eukprot:TMW64937.1 hypothetical protein Poli38472_009104 [Pythium oligandrum]
MEQPKVKLTYNVLNLLEGVRTTSNDGQKTFFRVVTMALPKRVQTLVQDDIRASNIKLFESDTNRDGVPDSLHVSLTTPLDDGEAIYKASVLVFLNVTVQNRVKLNMDAFAILSHESGLPGASLHADGDLQLRMRNPIRITKSMQTPYETNPLLNVSRVVGAQDLAIDKLIAQYRNRDCLMHLDVPYPVWTSDLGVDSIGSSSRSFHIDLTIRIPPMEILYRPTWSELLKTAWIQYFSILVIVYGIVHAVAGFLFQHRLLQTYSVLDDASILTKQHT